MLVQELTTVTVPFISVHLGDIIATFAVIITYLLYRLDKRKEAREKLKEDSQISTKQSQMHWENSRKLNDLLDHKKEQEARNEKLDLQVEQLKNQTGELKQQTALLSSMAKGQEQRLQRIERKQDREDSERTG